MYVSIFRPKPVPSLSLFSIFNSHSPFLIYHFLSFHFFLTPRSITLTLLRFYFHFSSSVSLSPLSLKNDLLLPFLLKASVVNGGKMASTTFERHKNTKTFTHVKLYWSSTTKRKLCQKLITYYSKTKLITIWCYVNSVYITPADFIIVECEFYKTWVVLFGPWFPHETFRSY